MPYHYYEIVARSRTPQASGAPVFTLLGPIQPKEKIGWSRELFGDGGFCNVSCDPDTLSDNIRSRLVDLFMYPTELQLFRDGILVFEGPIINAQVQGATCTLAARSVLYYARYMHITTDLTYTATDQYTIIKNLFDHHQNKSYGHFGIDVSGVGASGVTLARKYLADESPNVLEELGRIAERENGFDYYVTLDANRDLVLTARRGSDKSTTIFIDERSIFSPQISMGCTAKEVASEVIAVGHSTNNAAVYASEVDPTMLAAFGRAQIVGAFEGVATQATIDEHASSLLDVCKVGTLTLGTIALLPCDGAEPVDDFDVGDTVTWDYDSGLGRQTVARDVVAFNISIGPENQEEVTIEFG
jgi:hypothetical protein